MVEPVSTIDPAEVGRRLAEVRERAGAAVEILVATKYVPVGLMPLLADAGIELVGENRLQELEDKHARHAPLFRWDFIGTVQSRKIPKIARLVSRIHSIDSASALLRLAALPDDVAVPEILVQVNIAGEKGKSGVAPADLPGLLADSPVPIAGLSTMPPATADPESSRRWFAALAELAAANNLAQLSMGTSQDWPTAVQEGATTIRLGASLLR